MEGTIPKVAFLCVWHWNGGPFIFLQRACAKLRSFGWFPEILLVPSGLPCTFDVAGQEAETRVIRNSYSWPELGKRLASAIRESNPDVVVGFAIRGGPIAMRYLYRSGSFSGRYLDLIQSDNPLEYARVRANRDFVAAIAGVSRYCVQTARQQVPELEGRFFRVYYPVSCPPTPPAYVTDDGRIRIVYLGILTQQYKRVLDLVPLVRELLARNVNFELTIIGDGSDRQKLESMLFALPGAANRVRFVGMLPNAEALHVLSRQHVLLLVSEVEGQAIAMLEAMALGVVPVVSDLPGLREIVSQGQTGLIAPVGATDAFASHIQYLAQNAEDRHRMAVAAWRTIQQDYEADVAVRKLAEVLGQVTRLPLPNPNSLAEDTYPQGTMNRYLVPQYIQGLKRRALRQVLF